MIPRADIIAVSLSSSLDTIIKAFQKESHSRMPVYRDNLDDVSGVIHIKDIVKFWDKRKAFKLSSYLKEALFVPPSMSVPDLLLTMRTRRLHMALVVDEYGGTDGLVTIEDLVEEIVGEIEDEHDAEDEEELVYKKSDNSITVDASYRVEDLEEFFSINIPRNEDDETSSVGGLVYEKINRIPKNNEIIDFNDELRIKIVKSNNRKIEIVEVNKNN